MSDSSISIDWINGWIAAMKVTTDYRLKRLVISEFHEISLLDTLFIYRDDFLLMMTFAADPNVDCSKCELLFVKRGKEFMPKEGLEDCSKRILDSILRSKLDRNINRWVSQLLPKPTRLIKAEVRKKKIIHKNDDGYSERMDIRIEILFEDGSTESIHLTPDEEE